VLAGAGNISIRVLDVAHTGAGFVAAGWSLDRPFGDRMLWTSPDGSTWTAHPGSQGDGMAAAAAVCGDTDRVVVVGWHGDLAGTGSVGAVWVGPPPDGVVSEPPAPPEAATPEVTVDPVVVTGSTRVWVRGRIEGGEGDVAVWLVPVAGDPLRLCLARMVGSRFDCRVYPDDVPVGLYDVALGLPEGVVPGLTLEIVPDGTRLASLHAVYHATLWPLLLTMGVRNDGDTPLDLTGWRLVSGGPEFAYPTGAVLDPGETFLLAFEGPGGGTCPESTDRFVHWCTVVGDGHRIDFDDGELLWRGGDVTLVDADGTGVATWSPPR
jgi:hypothetical protein